MLYNDSGLMAKMVAVLISCGKTLFFFLFLFIFFFYFFFKSVIYFFLCPLHFPSELQAFS